MNRYLTFSAEDFACDEDFLRWVKYPEGDPFLDTFWQKWLRENPHKKEIIEEARHMILAVTQEKQYFPDEGKQSEIWDRIRKSAQLPLQKKVVIWQTWYSKAAVVLITLGIGWYAIGPETDDTVNASSEEADSQYVRQINNASVPETIILSDGTSIILQPKSALEYPETFRPDVREVRLTGQAFFEVVRDASRPFLVQSGEIVTRVLGTSFTVRNFEGEDNVLIQVKTGKVSVFMAREKDRSLQADDNTVEGVVLMPNQQVLFQRVEMKMTKSLVENPSVLIPLTRLKFEFVDAPIRDVFAAIEEAYGVDIVFDEEALSSCYLNASLTDVALFDKLKLICKGINTTYEVIDSHIIIYGTGCKDDITNPNPN